jgi:hypothetical protein
MQGRPLFPTYLRLLFAPAYLLLIAWAVPGLADARLPRVQSAHSQVTPATAVTAESACTGFWNIVPSPNAGDYNNGRFYAASALSSDDVWTVGDSTSFGGSFPRTLVQHWDGTQWSITPSLSPASWSNNLYGVVAITPNDVWAVGNQSNSIGGTQRTLIEHWDGTQWSIIPSPNAGTDKDFLGGVDAVSSDDVWAVGRSVSDGVQQTLIEHWDGTQWSIVPTPNGAGEDSLTAVSAITDSDVWAVGTLIMHWDGTEWSIIPNPSSGSLTGIVALAPDDVWAVGSELDQAQVGQTLTLHWDGSQWSTIPSPSPGTDGNRLSAVSGTASGDVWAVGYYYSDADCCRTLILHWDGSSWLVTDSPNSEYETYYLRGVAAVGPNDVWAVGVANEGSRFEYTLVERYTDQFTDVLPDTPFYSYVHCLSCRNMIRGYVDGTFRPNNDVTRGQLAKIASNAAGFNEPTTIQTFEDVYPYIPFYPFVERLAARGIVDGYPCGSQGEPCNPPDNRPYFRPNSNVTRGQLAKIVSSTAGLDTTPIGQFYTDVAEDHPFYLWIMRLTELEVMSGYDCGGEGEPCDDQDRPYFRPYNSATRGQASKIVANTFFPDCQILGR